MKKLLIIFSLILFAGCAPGNIGSNPTVALFEGQWDEPQKVGPDKYLIRGWASQEAMYGATEFCGRTNKKYELIDMLMASANSAARLIFRCY